MCFIHKTNIWTHIAVNVLSLLHVSGLTSPSLGCTTYRTARSVADFNMFLITSCIVDADDCDVIAKTCRRDKTFTAVSVHMLLL
jgi:hypothetical protein